MSTRAPKTLLKLVEQSQHGNPYAQRELLGRVKNRVFSTCLKASNQHHDTAQDLSQEVFLNMFRSLPKLREPARFCAWLNTITNHVCHKYIYRLLRERAMLEAFWHEQRLVLDRRSDELRRKELQKAIRRALLSIEDDKKRKIMVMKYTEPGYTTLEIAHMTGFPHGTVTVTLQRFRKQFQTQLAQELEMESFLSTKPVA